MIHRIASSERYSSGLAEIQTKWSVLDLCDANAVLDAYEEVEARAAEDARRGR